MSVNPVSVAKAFLELVSAQFPEYASSREPSEIEKEIALLIFEKFGDISINYQLVDESDNTFDFEVSNTASSEQTTDAQSIKSSQSQNFIPSQGKSRKTFVSIKQKAKILKLIQDHPNYSFKTVKSQYPAYKYPAYKKRWKSQVQNGGSKDEILEEIRRYTFKCFKEAREQHQPVHDRDISRWALRRATDFPSIRTQFTASLSWINTFKMKHRISSRKVTKLVSKREMANQEEVLKSAEEFREKIKQLQLLYNLSEIWNTDQIGFQYEYFSNRTLTYTGEKFVFGAAFSPKNCMTHSYTMQYVINADGFIVGKPFMCLQEPTGKIGETAKRNMFQAPNLEITCSASGKLTSTHVSYFVEKVLKPEVKGRILYILDSWGGHTQETLYQDAFSQEGVEFSVQIIPKHCTPLVQPLDVYFNLQLKFLVKRIYDHANSMNRRITARNEVIKVQSLCCFLLSSPIFRSMIQYCFLKAGLIEKEREYFYNVKDVCFSFKSPTCEVPNCKNISFIKCSHCDNILCFNDLFDEFHVFKCTKSVYMKE